MGKHNFISLGFLSSIILHHIRNLFKKKHDIRISKRVQKKILLKHQDVSRFTHKTQFQELINNAIAIYDYNSKGKGIICKHNSKFIIIGLTPRQHHISCDTIYSANEKKLKRLKKESSFQIIDKNQIEFFETI